MAVQDPQRSALSALAETAPGRWYSALTQREQIMVAILAVLVAAIIGWFAIIAPVNRGVDNANRRLGEVGTAAGRINAKLELLESSAEVAPPPLASSLSVVLASEADARGFALEQNTPQGDGAADIAIAAVRAPVLFGWLAELEARGIAVRSLSVRPTSGGAVAATISLAMQGQN